MGPLHEVNSIFAGIPNIFLFFFRLTNLSCICVLKLKYLPTGPTLVLILTPNSARPKCHGRSSEFDHLLEI